MAIPSVDRPANGSKSAFRARSQRPVVAVQQSARPEADKTGDVDATPRPLRSGRKTYLGTQISSYPRFPECQRGGSLATSVGRATLLRFKPQNRGDRHRRINWNRASGAHDGRTDRAAPLAEHSGPAAACEPLDRVVRRKRLAESGGRSADSSTAAMRSRILSLIAQRFAHPGRSPRPFRALGHVICQTSAETEAVSSGRGVTKVYPMGEVEVHALRGDDCRPRVSLTSPRQPRKMKPRPPDRRRPIPTSSV